MTSRKAAAPSFPVGGPLSSRLPADQLLTPHRVDLLTMAANGMTNPDIAKALWLSEETAKTHFRHIYMVLGAKDRANAVALGIVRGFVRPDQIVLRPPRDHAA